MKLFIDELTGNVVGSLSSPEAIEIWEDNLQEWSSQDIDDVYEGALRETREEIYDMGGDVIIEPYCTIHDFNSSFIQGGVE